MPKRTHGVITSLSPCIITVNRVEYAADAVPGAVVGAVVTFKPGERATGVKLLKPARKPERYVQYAGIVVARPPTGGFDLRSLPELEPFFREKDDADLHVGDHLLFEVASDDGIAWNLLTRRSLEEDDDDTWREERRWLQSL